MDIPADEAPALASVVSALVGLSEPWQTVQVWARLDHVLFNWPNTEDGLFETIGAISLSV